MVRIVRPVTRSWRWWVLPLIILFVYIGWNAPLWWGLAKPMVISLGQSNQAAASVIPTASGSPRFSYPRLGIEAPFTETANGSPLAIRDWGVLSGALKQGVSVMYPSTATLAEAPLVYVTGHSSDTYPHPYSSVFAGLGQAKTGDVFYIQEPDRVIQYKVMSIKLVSPSDVKAFTPTVQQGKQEALLVTCWPPLTTWKRLVVTGVPVR